MKATAQQQGQKLTRMAIIRKIAHIHNQKKGRRIGKGQLKFLGFDAASTGIKSKDFPLLFSNVADCKAQFFG